MVSLSTEDSLIRCSENKANQYKSIQLANNEKIVSAGVDTLGNSPVAVQFLVYESHELTVVTEESYE